MSDHAGLNRRGLLLGAGAAVAATALGAAAAEPFVPEFVTTIQTGLLGCPLSGELNLVGDYGAAEINAFAQVWDALMAARSHMPFVSVMCVAPFPASEFEAAFKQELAKLGDLLA